MSEITHKEETTIHTDQETARALLWLLSQSGGDVSRDQWNLLDALRVDLVNHFRQIDG